MLSPSGFTIVKLSVVPVAPLPVALIVIFSVSLPAEGGGAEEKM
jgi:hypothetical protein